MSAQTLSDYLSALDRTAREMSGKEDDYRRDAAKRFKELARERAFAFRRLNLMREIVFSVSDAKDEQEATERGTAAFKRELDWTGATESQRQTTERFLPVIVACWLAAQPEADQTQDVSVALADFENWYAERGHGPFLALLEREVVELPLVEI